VSKGVAVKHDFKTINFFSNLVKKWKKIANVAKTKVHHTISKILTFLKSPYHADFKNTNFVYDVQFCDSF
jgi:hypothetical protein